MDVDATKQKGRSLGSDIKEGNPTLLSIYALEKLKGYDKENFKKLFGKKDLSKNELQQTISYYEKTLAITNLKKDIKHYIDNTNQILNDINIPQKHWIFSFGNYCLQRSN
jgi:geranylgeranyl pyrophosphate synthase